MADADNIEGCCNLAFDKEFLEKGHESNEQDFDDDDDFLSLFLSACFDVTATKAVRQV